MKTIAAPATNFDASFDNVPNLTWLPWIGAEFPRRNPNERLLIVAESHYSNEKDPEKMQAALKRLLKARTYTREVVSECPINGQWRNKTLEAIAKLLFATPHIDRQRFWNDTAFYNFIQRPMDYGTRRERPRADEFVQGWQVFADVVRIIQPSHCIFIGLSAADRFDSSMTAAKILFRGVKRTKKIGRTSARSAVIQIDDRSTELCFVKHTSQYFSWRQWHEYLKADYAGLMTWTANEEYTTQPSA